VLSVLRLGIESLPIKEQAVTIRLHPDDVILVEQLYSTAQLTRSKWELEVDPTLSAGDCILSSHRSLVDLTLSSRIDTVFESLRNQHAHLSDKQHQLQETIEAEDTAKQVPVALESELDDQTVDDQAVDTVNQDAEDMQSTSNTGEHLDTQSDAGTDAKSPTPTAE